MADKQKVQHKVLELKVQQLLEELSRREAHVRSEEAKLNHLEKYGNELQERALSLTKREEMVQQWEIKQSKRAPSQPHPPSHHHYNSSQRQSTADSFATGSSTQQQEGEEGGKAPGGVSPTGGNVTAEGSLLPLGSGRGSSHYSPTGGGCIGGTVAMLIGREERVQIEEARIQTLQAALIQQRQEMGAERQEFDRKVAEAEEDLGRQRDDLRKRVTAHQVEVELLSSRQDEQKTRDEERDVYTRLVHDLESSEERARRTLLATQEDYHTKVALLEVERGEFEADSEELRLQWKEYDRRKKESEAIALEVTEETVRLRQWEGIIIERERHLKEATDQSNEDRELQRKEARQLQNEREEVAILVRRNEVLAREMEIDAARAEDASRRASDMNRATALLQQAHDVQREYLQDWEAELQGREDEMARLIEFVVGIPKTHQSTEVQSMNAGLLQLQQKRLNDNYASGQRRRVQTATVNRFGGGIHTSGASAATAAASSSGVFASRLPQQSNRKKTPLEGSNRRQSLSPTLSSLNSSVVTAAADIPLVAASSQPLSHKAAPSSRPPTTKSQRQEPPSRLLRPLTATSTGGFSTRALPESKQGGMHKAKNNSKTIEEGIAAESRIVTLLRAIDTRKRRFNSLAARAKLLNKERDESSVEAFFKKLSPSQRLDVEVAIHRERDFANEIGLRQLVMQCPFGVDPGADPRIQIQRISKWWSQLGDHLMATDERSLEGRMELLERAVTALRSAHERARCTEDGDDILPTSPLPLAVEGDDAVQSDDTPTPQPTPPITPRQQTPPDATPDEKVSPIHSEAHDGDIPNTDLHQSISTPPTDPTPPTPHSTSPSSSVSRSPTPSSSLSQSYSDSYETPPSSARST